MPSGIEVTKQALDDFKKIQEYMLLAKRKMLQKHMPNWKMNTWQLKHY